MTKSPGSNFSSRIVPSVVLCVLAASEPRGKAAEFKLVFSAAALLPKAQKAQHIRTYTVPHCT